jgi:two-component system, LytTR family, response regulator
MKLRAIVADDEPLARERIRTLLEAEGDIQIVAECGNGRDTVEAIDAEGADIVFLDVQMPELDGFEVVEAIGTSRMPAVVFVTAYDQYALRAFESHALDYLLKPFDQERFQRALQRARTQVQRQRGGELDDKLRDLLASLGPKPGHIERIVVRTGARLVFLRVDEIDWMDAEGNYIRLHVGKKSYLLRETMSGMEAKLDPARFIRIHRSTIVNIDRIKELESLFQGEYLVILHDGTKLTSSRGYRDRVRELLEGAS